MQRRRHHSRNELSEYTSGQASEPCSNRSITGVRAKLTHSAARLFPVRRSDVQYFVLYRSKPKTIARERRRNSDANVPVRGAIGFAQRSANTISTTSKVRLLSHVQ